MNLRSAVLVPLVAIVATVVLTAAQTKTSPARAKVMASLQGTWVLTTSDGQDMSGSGQEVLVTIEGDKYTQTANGQVVERGSFTIDEAKKPMTIDIAILEGANAGTKQVGVIEVDAKTMRGKLSLPGGTSRPTDFAMSEGFTTFVFMKR